ncbi:MAG: hypothetical protein Q3974_08550 [Rothia sp. (in: high G+C Gram-positive bacteria)]|nr:hypothetical protein [Rothia sp. (in: high G+C Gram-positive bacteria)]
MFGMIAVRNPTNDAVFIGKLIEQRHPEKVALLVMPVQDEVKKFDVQFLFSDRSYTGGGSEVWGIAERVGEDALLCKGTVGSQGSGSVQWHHQDNIQPLTALLIRIAEGVSSHLAQIARLQEKQSKHLQSDVQIIDLYEQLGKRMDLISVARLSLPYCLVGSNSSSGAKQDSVFAVAKEYLHRDDEEYSYAGVLVQIWGSNSGELIVIAQGAGRFWAPWQYRGLDAPLEGRDIPQEVGFLIPLLARKVKSLH